MGVVGPSTRVDVTGPSTRVDATVDRERAARRRVSNEGACIKVRSAPVRGTDERLCTQAPLVRDGLSLSALSRARRRQTRVCVAVL